jgi:malonyl-CoA/methylmalonyl-CoA synthetase
MIELIRRASEHGARIAFRTPERDCRYAELLVRSAALARALLSDAADLAEERIAFLQPAGADYAITQWALWRAGAIAVPLNREATAPELVHVLATAGVRRVLSSAPTDALRAACAEAGAVLLDPAGLERSLEAPGADPDRRLPDIDPARRAMIVFTSGTTSKPKGAVSTHAGIAAQITALVEAWAWRADDRIPLFLPLHHVHGIVNVLCCALWSGAGVEPFEGFRQEAILARVRDSAYSLFMAVPTVYAKLVQALEAMPDDERESTCAGFAAMRLMVSGSAALPVPLHERWEALTGQRLLERYGMTEIGMALSNPLVGERRSGSVGLPLPGVEIRLVDEEGLEIGGEDNPGELQVRGPAVFREYWDRPDATAASFTPDGWFRTGDVAVRERGYYRILGRQSVDIIKSGGYKLSALEIEGVLLTHPAIRECAVLGLPDPVWGEVVATVVVLREDAALDEAGLRAWCAERLSAYKQPRRLCIVDSLPRNAMGKVVKPELRQLFAG